MTTATAKPRILVLEALSGSSAAITAAGGIAVKVSPSASDQVCELLDNAVINGVLLTGGGDVDPRLYGRRAHKKVYGVSETRDLVERVVLEVAKRRNWPVFGICRGIQIMNVQTGGTLTQHIGGHSGTEHPVTITGPTMLGAVGASTAHVISLHHQCVRDIAEGFTVAARAGDGTPEAIESLDGRCLAVQFHPEMDAQEDYARGLFRWLVLEAAHRAGNHVEAGPQSPKVTHKYVQSLGKTYYGKSVKGKARDQRKTDASKSGPVTTYFYCGGCGITFDEKEDYADHMVVLHNVEANVDVITGSGAVKR